jgi:hypothetical protein
MIKNLVDYEKEIKQFLKQRNKELRQKSWFVFKENLRLSKKTKI